MSNKVNVEIISASPKDTDFIAWIVAQGMHMDSVPPFLKKHGARDDTLYSCTKRYIPVFRHALPQDVTLNMMHPF